MLYDPEANIISWEIGKGKITNTREFGNFIVHLSSAGKPLLVEILDASKFIGQYDKIKNVGDIKKILPTANQLN